MNIHPQSYTTLRRLLQEVEQPRLGMGVYEMSVPTYLHLKKIADEMAEYNQQRIDYADARVKAKSAEEEIAEAQAAAQALAEKYHGEVTVNGFDADGNVLGSFTGVCRCENCSVTPSTTRNSGGRRGD